MSEAPEERHDLDRELTDRLDDDDRFGSGVPEHLRGSDLDFIQMTGLTAPDPGARTNQDSHDESLNPELPVSFYEEGVDDVDTTSEPLGTEVHPGVNDEIVATKDYQPVRSSIASLREIVADLSRRGVDAEADNEDRGDDAETPPPDAERAPADSDLTQETPPNTETRDDDRDDDPQAEANIDDDSDVEMPMAALTADLSDDEDTTISMEDDPVTPVDADPTISHAIMDLDDPNPQPGYTVTLSDSDGVEDDTQAASATSARLNAAESLLSRLERDMNAVGESDEESFEMPELPEPVVPHDSEPESDQSVYNRPSTPSRGRGRRRRRGVAKRIARMTAYGVLLVVLGGVATYGYRVYWQQTASDHDIYRVNVRHFENGRYTVAAQGFESFANRYPGSPLAADALFMAAQTYEVLGDSASLARAAGLYQRFMDEHPAHPKVHRAATMLGLNHVKTGAYDRAIEILGKPDLRKIDPEGYLAALRGLAASHAALGQVEEARSAYLRAASLEGNYSADRDYLALADMYMTEAESAVTPQDRIGLIQRAIEQWDFAARVPGITETRRREIRMRRDVAMEEIGARPENAVIPEAVTVPDAPIDTSLEEKYEQEQQRLMTID